MRPTHIQTALLPTIEQIKAVGSLALLRWVSTEPLDFFLYQLFVSALDPIAMGFFFYRRLPATNHRPGVAFSWKVLRPALPFGLSVAYVSAI